MSDARPATRPAQPKKFVVYGEAGVPVTVVSLGAKRDAQIRRGVAVR